MSSYTKSKCTKLALKCKMENEALTDFEQLRGKRSVSNILKKKTD